MLLAFSCVTESEINVPHVYIFSCHESKIGAIKHNVSHTIILKRLSVLVEIRYLDSGVFFFSFANKISMQTNANGFSSVHTTKLYSDIMPSTHT